MQTLEKFVVMMYDRSSTFENVNDARLDMFAQNQRPYEAIPPTRQYWRWMRSVLSTRLAVSGVSQQ